MRTSEHILLKTFIITVILTSALLVSGQRQSTKEYIEKWDEVAVQQMHDHGIPASITLAQGILESGSGNSELSKKSNNHFGIKCGSNWKGKSVRYDDDRKRECFRKYPNAAQSFHDHSDFLKRDRYARLLNQPVPASGRQGYNLPSGSGYFHIDFPFLSPCSPNSLCNCCNASRSFEYTADVDISRLSATFWTLWPSK